MIVEYNKDNKITEIFVSGDSRDFYEENDTISPTYLAAVSIVFLSLDINNNDYKSIISHLTEKSMKPQLVIILSMHLSRMNTIISS